MASESPQQARPAERGRRRLFPLAGSLPASVEPSALADVATTAVTSDDSELGPAGLPEDAARFVRALRTPAVWVDASGAVVWAHPAMEALRVVSRRAVRVPEVAAMVEQSRRTDQVVQRDLAVKRPGRRQPKLSLRVRVSPMRGGAVLVLVEDMSEAERLDRVRRDFVANVSHELKTPVGAVSLLAEALADAADDPDAVRRFAGRMQHEADRLTRLVQDVIELSRLQGHDPLAAPVLVSLDEIVAESVDRSRLTAEARGITVVCGGVRGLKVMGDSRQLVTALGNLVDNAVRYGPERSRVAVSVAETADPRGRVAEVSVTDEGPG
ncbi:MAG TPA: HAMP domain-containing sensor histidine kinase, partial [Candidatus Nanopelagicales bacterium]